MKIPDEVLLLIREEQIRQNGLFIPDTSQYLDKLSQKAELLVHYGVNEVLGYVFFYCNSADKNFSYITLLGTSLNARGKSVGAGLVDSVTSMAKLRGFAACRLEVAIINTVAYRFYVRMGFVPIEDRESKHLMEKKL